MRMTELDRKAATRKKIQLGDLIIKAGLDDESTALLYGLLLAAKEQLTAQNQEAICKWQLKGELAFKEGSNYQVSRG